MQSLERERTDVQKHRDECGLENNCFFLGENGCIVRTASMCSEFWKTGTEGIPVCAPIRPHVRVCSRSEMLHVRNWDRAMMCSVFGRDPVLRAETPLL